MLRLRRCRLRLTTLPPQCNPPEGFCSIRNEISYRAKKGASLYKTLLSPFIVFHCIACSHPCSRCSDFRSFSRIALPAKMPLPQRSESYNPKFPFAHLIQTADSALDILQMQISTQSRIASRQPVPPKDRCPAPVSLPPLPPYKGYKAA